MAVHPAGFAPGQFGKIGIALLRHNAAAGSEFVGQADQVELPAGPQHQFLGKAGKVQHTDGRGGLVFQEKIPVGNGVHAVGGDFREVQFLSQKIPVRGIGDAGQSAAAQGHTVDPAAAVPESGAIPLEHLKISQQVVGEQDRLGPLQVGIAGDQHAVILFGQGQQGCLDAAHGGQGVRDNFPSVEAEVEGHLVVAGAAGVEAAAGGAN